MNINLRTLPCLSKAGHFVFDVRSLQTPKIHNINNIQCLLGSFQNLKFLTIFPRCWQFKTSFACWSWRLPEPTNSTEPFSTWPLVIPASSGLQNRLIGSSVLQIIRNVFVLKNKNQTVEFHALGSVSFKILIYLVTFDGNNLSNLSGKHEYCTFDWFLFQDCHQQRGGRLSVGLSHSCSCHWGQTTHLASWII